jgi:hypothetical protein
VRAAAGNVFALGTELARPVLKGWVVPDVADAIITLHAVRTTPPGFKFEHWAAGAIRFMADEYHRLQQNEDRVAYRIEQRTKDLFRRLEPSNIMLRDACDLNAEAGRPFEEIQVRAIVAETVRVLIAARRRHGR